MPTTLLQIIETKRKKVLTEHRKRHNENRKREDKYKSTSSRSSGGAAGSGSTFSSGGLGRILRFPRLVVKQLKQARAGGGGIT